MKLIHILLTMVLTAMFIVPMYPLYTTYKYTSCVEELTNTGGHLVSMQRLFKSRIITVDQAFFYLRSKALECTFGDL